MSTNDADREKAQVIFRSLFGELDVKWVDPKFDFNLDVYVARIESGMMRGRTVSIPYQKLRDADITEDSIRKDLLDQLR